MSDLDKIKSSIDQLLIQSTMNIAHIQVLTDMVLDLHKHEDDYSFIHINFYNELKDHTSNVLQFLSETLHKPSVVNPHLFDLELFVKMKLHEVDKNNEES